MDTVDTIKKILTSKVYVEVRPADMSTEDSMRDVFGVDSLGFVELRAQVEEAFDVAISDDEFTPENFMTIGRLRDLIDRLVAERSAVAH